MSTMAVSSWSELPADILQIICQKLTDIKDYVFFGAVCSYWSTILWLCHKHIPTQLPLLMFPNVACTPSPFKRFKHRILSMKSFKVSVLPNTTIKFTNYFGLNHGWILIRNDFGFLYLVNPFLSANNFIKLPYLEGSDKGLKSAVLSDNPSLTSNYVVMITCRRSKRYEISFFRSGEKSWRNHHTFLDTVIYYKDQFYGVHFYSQELVSIDTSSVQLKVTKLVKLPAKRTQSIYLVESSGELLCLVRNSSWYRTSPFQIFKLDQTATLPKWNEVKDLRGHALFLGDGGNTSFSVLASNFHNCRANGIYFTAHYDPRHVKLFNLDDSTVVNLFYKKDYSAGSCNGGKYPAIWIQPSLNMIKGNHSCDAHINVDTFTSRCVLSNSVKKHPRRKRLYR